MPVELSNASARATICPEFGGMLNELILKTDEQEIALIYGYSEGECISDAIHTDFRNVKLSPFPNRIKDGKYSFDGVKYQLPINFPSENNSIHGLVYNKPFKIVLQTSSQLVLSYEFKPSLVYPFFYRLTLEYVLIGKRLICKTKIENLGKTEMPIADGFHPYFKLSGTIDNVKLQLPKVEALEVDDRLIPTGKFIPFNNFQELELIGSVTKFDTGFKIIDDSKVVDTKLTSDTISLTIRQEIGKDKYAFLQLFIPDDRKSIAIEPMTAAANAFNNELGLIILPPNSIVDMSLELAFDFIG